MAQVFSEILTQGKNVTNIPNKVRPVSGTYGYAKYREPIKNWSFPSYLGSRGPNWSKFYPNDQNHNYRSRGPKKDTFPHDLKPRV